MALDLGDVRIGIAMSDLMQIIASPYETYLTREEEQDLDFIADLVKKNSVRTIVLGLPLNMDGSEGIRALKARNFAEKLSEKTKGIKIVFQDERLSSVSAEDILIEAGMRREDRRKVIDKIAATIILKSYMDTHKKGEY